MKDKYYNAWFFLGPALVCLTIFFFIPVLSSFMMSFTDFDIYSLGDFSKARFTLFDNFSRLFRDPAFWKAISNTFIFVLFAGPFTVFFSFSAAIVLNSKTLRFKGLFRAAFYMPVVTTLVAVAVVWRYLYHPKFGLINYFLSKISLGPIDFLGDPRYALWAIIILTIWKNFGFYMIIFLAGLQNIPESLYEAAKIDGAGKLRRIYSITIPRLAPTTFFVVILTLISYFQVFAEPYIMTEGGPLNSTLSIVLYMYQQGFKWWKMGYSASIAFVFFICILLFSFVNYLIRKKNDHENKI